MHGWMDVWMGWDDLGWDDLGWVGMIYDTKKFCRFTDFTLFIEMPR